MLNKNGLRDLTLDGFSPFSQADDFTNHWQAAEETEGHTFASAVLKQ